MKLLAGLGNPDQKYRNTRHNLGFIVIEKLREYLSENYISNEAPYRSEAMVRGEVEKFSDFTFDKNFNAKVSVGKINDEKIILAMPQTYMNNSGFAVQKLVQFYKLGSEKDILVIYDDIDLPLGEIRTTGEGSGGHRGMESIINLLGTKKIPRLRLGILGKPKNEIRDTASYVLQKFEKDELEKITKEVLPKCIIEIKNFLEKSS